MPNPAKGCRPPAAATADYTQARSPPMPSALPHRHRVRAASRPAPVSADGPARRLPAGGGAGAGHHADLDRQDMANDRFWNRLRKMVAGLHRQAHEPAVGGRHGDDRRRRRTCPNAGSFTIDTDLVTSGNQDTLTFTDSNWDDAQTVRITAIADADTGTTTPGSVRCTTAPPAGATTTSPTTKIYVQPGIPRTKLARRPSVQKTVNGLEGSKNRTYKVWLSDAPNADVTVTITFKSGDSDISIDTDAGHRRRSEHADLHHLRLG